MTLRDQAVQAGANAYMRYEPPYDDPSEFSEQFLSDMRSALDAALDVLRDEEAIVEVLRAHALEATGLGEVACRCDHEWRSWASYYAHQARAVVAHLKGEA